ncbi:unnamed protein product [Knipowitschia caucasica]|uniref:Uncharacterized protein n=1 Tax=Knipowitschia caucasica TaxID=637954 RepID=A0AAV2IYC7_KNICA
MQPSDAKLYRNSLSRALRSYSAAVSDMERTILVPSLLRDVPSDELRDCEESRDLYESYQMLKAIRTSAESSLGSQVERKVQAGVSSLEPVLDAEGLFHFHLWGLFSVMRDLTVRTQNLTEKYKEIIGVAD